MIGKQITETLFDYYVNLLKLNKHNLTFKYVYYKCSMYACVYRDKVVKFYHDSIKNLTLIELINLIMHELTHVIQLDYVHFDAEDEEQVHPKVAKKLGNGAQSNMIEAEAEAFAAFVTNYVFDFGSSPSTKTKTFLKTLIPNVKKFLKKKRISLRSIQKNIATFVA